MAVSVIENLDTLRADTMQPRRSTHMTITSQLNRAREVGTPLVAVATADQPATASAIAREMVELKHGKGPAPVIGWDILRGYHPRNKIGEDALAKMLGEMPVEATRNLGAALNLAAAAPPFTVLLFMNAQRLMDEPIMAQGIMNLRDLFKVDGRTLVLLGPSFDHLPAEIGQDILVFDEPLPTREELRKSTEKLYEDNEVKSVASETLDRSADALAGLAPFPAESAASLAVDEKGKIDIGHMWQRKFRAIENVRGLTMSLPKIGFANMGGCREIVSYIDEIASGPCRPKIIVWLDEFEKMIAGGGGSGPGESSGTSQDQIKVLLTDMERYGWVGDLRVGPPGCSKSLSVQLMAGHLGVPLAEADLGAAKSKWVGESEAQIRALVKAILAMGGEGPGVYFAATCNSLESLSAPLRRRFSAPGSTPFMFDLPDEDELEAIGNIQLAHWERLAGRALTKDRGFFRKCIGWSGANVRDCCRVAYSRGRQIEEVIIVPAAQQDKVGLEKLRQMAHGIFLSASYPGTYKKPSEQPEVNPGAGRKFGARKES